MRPLITAATYGYIYVIHLARPLGNLANTRAQAHHYTGFALDVDARFQQHASGQGSKLTRAAVAQGISLELVAHWPAALGEEKALKARKCTPRYCPRCCAAHGWRCRVPSGLQLAFDLEDELPDVSVGRMDWLEMQIQREWRAVRIPAPAGIDDDLL
jgi:predicted GIY-YIG superfamily endonuclease